MTIYVSVTVSGISLKRDPTLLTRDIVASVSEVWTTKKEKVLAQNYQYDYSYNLIKINENN